MEKYYKYIGSDDPDNYFIVEHIENVHCKGGHFCGKVIDSHGQKIHNIGYRSNGWLKEVFEPYEMPDFSPSPDYWEEAEREMYKNYDSYKAAIISLGLNFLKQKYSLVKKSKDEGNN